MDDSDFIPQLIVGYYKKQPAVISAEEFVPFVGSSVVTAAWMLTIFEAMERYLPDSEQLTFEKEVMKAYKKLLKERHDRTVHLKRKK